jgi:protein SCO1/2
MPRRWVRAVAAVAAGGLSMAVGCGDDDAAEDGLQGIARTPPLEVADVALPEASTGELTPMRAEDGELLLVYFGYTNCPDVCPTTMSDIRVALEDLPTDVAERVTVAMVTLDPDRDTAAVLTGYLGHFFDTGLALRTTDPVGLQTATDAFGVQWEVEQHEPGEPYAVSHSAVTYVVDHSGTVVDELPFGIDVDAIAQDLDMLLKEETT